MDKNDLVPNSHRYKAEKAAANEEKKKIEKVVTGTVKTKKKNEISKLANIFISEDVKNVKSYVFMDVLVPAIKKAISDIVTDGIDMILYGGSGKSKRNSGTRTSYRSYYDSRDNERRTVSASTSRFDNEDIIFANRGEAEAVLDQLVEALDKYKFVTVADLYDAAGLTAPYTSNKYGWTNLNSAEPQRVREGYVLRLPRAMPID